ncbi:MAG: glycosyltransferase family 4 protein [Anaerolineales bacterium]|nr:glycosyltransferase family 4 protein [Anaerolineales bacterium]
MAKTEQSDLVLFFTEGVSLATWDEGGMLPREVALYQRLTERGKRIEFVTYGGPGDQKYAKKLHGIQLRHNVHRLPWALYKLGLQWMPPHGKVFKSNQVYGAQVVLKAAHTAGAKFIARCGYLLSDFQERQHGDDSKQAEEAHALEKLVFEGADRIVVTTAAMAQSIQNRFNISPNTIRVIPNYVETDRFSPKPRPANSKLRVGFVGRLNPQKNLGLLLEALAGLDVELSLAGDGPLRDQLMARAKTLQIPIDFQGRLDHASLPAFLNACDLFVLPSLYEGHPKALLEAMACGLPVIGTRVPGIADLLQDDRTGLLSEPDAASLQTAIQRLMTDGKLRARLGRTAREYIVQNFSLDRVVQMELALSEELAREDA